MKGQSFFRMNLCMLLLVLILTGCYESIPVPTAQVQVGEPTATMEKHHEEPTVTPALSSPTAPPPSPTPMISQRIIFIRRVAVRSCAGCSEEITDNLWSVALDGSNLEQLTHDESPGIGYHIPAEGEPVKILFASADPLSLSTELVQQVPIPEACQIPPFPEYEGNSRSRFTFSPSGRYLAFEVGGSACGNVVLRVLDRQTAICVEVKDSDRLIEWLPDDRALVTSARCEGGNISVYVPQTEQVTPIEIGNLGGWNEGKTVVWGTRREVPFGWWYESFWAYNLDLKAFIHSLPEYSPEGYAMETFEGWTPDDTHMIYASRWISYTDVMNSLPVTVSVGPQQLYVADIAGQRDVPLFADSTHNYFLRGKEGDSLLIQATPYEPFVLPANSPPFEWTLLQDCPFSGKDCPEAEYLTLNWQTGAISSMASPFPTPTAAVTATPVPGPSSTPVYEAVDRSFALYAGQSGEGLWYIPASGNPELIMPDGHQFIYVDGK